MPEPTGTHPFAPFEWMLSLRYLRARRKEGFISVIAGFSFLGIMLGVATLIIVMAVMNGFRHELLDKILGLNGDLLIQPLDSPLDRLGRGGGSRLQGRRRAPRRADRRWAGAGVFAISVPRACSFAAFAAAIWRSSAPIARNIKRGTLDGFDQGQGVAIGSRLAEQLSAAGGRQHLAPYAARRRDAVRHLAAHEDL